MTQTPAILNYSDEPPGMRIVCERLTESIRIFLPRQGFGAQLRTYRWRALLCFVVPILIGIAVRILHDALPRQSHLWENADAMFWLRPLPLAAGMLAFSFLSFISIIQPSHEVEIIARPTLVKITRMKINSENRGLHDMQIIQADNIREIRAGWNALIVRQYRGRTLRIVEFTGRERLWAARTIQGMIRGTLAGR